MSTSISRRVGFVTIGKTAILLLSVVGTPILIQSAGRSVYGSFAYYLATISIVTSIVSPSISGGIRRFFSSSEVGNGKANVLSSYFTTATIISIFAALLLLVSQLNVIETRSLLNRSIPIEYFLLYLCIIPFHAYFHGSILAKELENYNQLILSIRRLIFFTFSIILLYYYRTVHVIIISYLLALTLSTVLAYFVFHMCENVSINIGIDDEFVEYLKFSSGNVVFTLLLASLYNVDVILISWYLNPELTGSYKAALVIAEFIWFVPQAVQMVFVHSVSDLWRENQTEKLSNIASISVKYTLVLSTLMIGGLIILADQFIPFYFGKEFSTAVTPLLVLLPGVLSFTLARPIFGIGQSSGRVRILIFATIPAAILNILLNVYLIPKLGISGAALATSVGYGSMFILHLFSAFKLGYNPIKDFPIGRILFSGVCLVTTLYLIDLLIEKTLFVLLISPICGTIVYLYILKKTDVIRYSELKQF